MAIIAVDFDGTCVTHEFPKIGEPIGAERVLRRLVEHGHQLILWTMRSDSPSQDYLTQAVQWFKDNNIPLWGINNNPDQHTWTTSPKCYAHLYIDDAALGIPLIQADRPYVDWDAVELMLIDRWYLKPA